MEYTVKLSSFEGPLDLLLFLIRKNELDIYDIPISLVVKQYIEYLGALDELSIDKAAQYLLMLATLMRIKSRMLLPGGEEELEEEAEDPRDELVQKLIEYQQFKEFAGDLEKKEAMRSLLYGRGGAVTSSPGQLGTELQELNVEIDNLITAFREAMERFSDYDEFVLEAVEFTVEEKMAEIMSNLEAKDSFSLEEFLRGCGSKLELIVLFLALLELMRLRRLRVRQRGAFGRMVVLKLPVQES